VGQVELVEEPVEQHVAKLPEQLAEIGRRRGQDNVDCVAGQPAQEAPPYPMTTLEMPDLRLDRTATPPASPLTAGKVL
jgi:hypothetical protein